MLISGAGRVKALRARSAQFANICGQVAIKL
jgi:hypothetical protein